MARPWYKRPPLLVLIGLLIVGVGVAAASAFSGNNGPSVDERAACGAMRDVQTSLASHQTADQVEKVVIRMATAANRTGDTKLITAADQAQVNIAAYRAYVDTGAAGLPLEQRWRPVTARLRDLIAACRDIGIAIHEPRPAQ